jgi:hypothetical protein
LNKGEGIPPPQAGKPSQLSGCENREKPRFHSQKMSGIPILLFGDPFAEFASHRVVRKEI